MHINRRPAPRRAPQVVDLAALAEAGVFDASYADTLKQVRAVGRVHSGWRHGAAVRRPP